MSIHQHNDIKIDLGCGRMPHRGYVGVDITQYEDQNGDLLVDVVRDVEKRGLPFCDNSADEILANDVLEHFQDLEFVLNECHRVLKPGGRLVGRVPHAGTDESYRDPTHKRFFTVSTFSYFTGQAAHNRDLPSHPRYAKYGFNPWIGVEVTKDGASHNINFILTPRK